MAGLMINLRQSKLFRQLLSDKFFVVFYKKLNEQWSIGAIRDRAIVCITVPSPAVAPRGSLLTTHF